MVVGGQAVVMVCGREQWGRCLVSPLSQVGSTHLPGLRDGGREGTFSLYLPRGGRGDKEREQVVASMRRGTARHHARLPYALGHFSSLFFYEHIVRAS